MLLGLGIVKKKSWYQYQYQYPYSDANTIRLHLIPFFDFIWYPSCKWKLQLLKYHQTPQACSIAILLNRLVASQQAELSTPSNAPCLTLSKTVWDVDAVVVGQSHAALNQRTLTIINCKQNCIHSHFFNWGTKRIKFG